MASEKEKLEFKINFFEPSLFITPPSPSKEPIPSLIKAKPPDLPHERVFWEALYAFSCLAYLWPKPYSTVSSHHAVAGAQEKELLSWVSRHVGLPLWMTCTCSAQQYFFVHFILPATASLAAVFCLVTQRTSLALRDETKTAARGSATVTTPVYTVADLIYYGNFQWMFGADQKVAGRCIHLLAIRR